MEECWEDGVGVDRKEMFSALAQNPDRGRPQKQPPECTVGTQPCGSAGKKSACNAEGTGDTGLIPGLG